jgi:hypothetical protein
MATRNPPWARDELILALDLYFRHPPSHISKDHPEVRQLSELLHVEVMHVTPTRISLIRRESQLVRRLRDTNIGLITPLAYGAQVSHSGTSVIELRVFAIANFPPLLLIMLFLECGF